ncbi:MAG: VOC family protein [Pseudomonadota bacterium]
MIIPNLMATDLGRSIAFYRDVVGMAFVFGVSATREDLDETAAAARGVFAVMAIDGAQLMLQTPASLAEDLDFFAGVDAPGPAGTVYIRDVDPDAVAARAPAGSLIKGPEQAWYGMREAYLRDPDGHIICVGKPEGPPPT